MAVVYGFYRLHSIEAAVHSSNACSRDKTPLDSSALLPFSLTLPFKDHVVRLQKLCNSSRSRSTYSPTSKEAGKEAGIVYAPAGMQHASLSCPVASAFDART